ncbi:MAG TPA: methyltransferase domain-containing protein [bacterium]|nr:methyltransferase domain-containing protein [bacterium]
MAADRLNALPAHYARQAAWTASLRAHVYRQVGLGVRERVLEVGSGGGAIAAELAAKTRGEVVGCDVDPAMLAAAQAAHPQIKFVLSEQARLPFADDCFDFVCCHFTLLWAADPVALLAEMKRVAQSGAAIAALAEPDWGGYLEWPDLGLRDLLCVALASEGADPLAGRKLVDWFALAGLNAQVGLTGGPWTTDEAGLDAAWEHHRLTLAGTVDARKLRVLEAKDRRAWREGGRLTHLPLAWALARK